MVGRHKLRIATNHIHFACLGHARQTACEFAYDFFFVATQHVDVDFRLGKLDAIGSQVFDFINHRRIVQQGFGWNTAHVQAHTTQSRVALNNRRFQTLVGSGKRSRITTRAAAQYHHIVFCISRACETRGLRRRHSGFRRFCCSRGCCWCGFCFRRITCSSFHHHNHAAFRNLATHGHFDFFDHTRGFSRHIHGGFVGFQGD